jgi:Tfp pilus assembly protein PilX
MTRHRIARSRAGVGLVEILVALTVMGIVGITIMRTFISQVRLADLQVKLVGARSVSRAPVNLFMSEARMVETGSGVVAASAYSVTLRVPVAFGIVCGTSGGSTALSLMPVDSVVLASAAISGHAWRQSSGAYAYTEGTTTMTSGGNGACNAASITTVQGGTTVLVTPAMNPAVSAGTPAFVYQRVRYEFKASTLLSGRTGLWRTLEASGATEELAAPFYSTSSFRFYRQNVDTSETVVPTLNQIRGLELYLVGASERPRFGRIAAETSPLQTAVFFVNRID